MTYADLPCEQRPPVEHGTRHHRTLDAECRIFVNGRLQLSERSWPSSCHFWISCFMRLSAAAAAAAASTVLSITRGQVLLEVLEKLKTLS